MGKLEQDFAAYRARMNERVLAEDNRVIKRIYSVDSLAYGEDGALPKQTKELLGLVEAFREAALQVDPWTEAELEKTLREVAEGQDREDLIDRLPDHRNWVGLGRQ